MADNNQVQAPTDPAALAKSLLIEKLTSARALLENELIAAPLLSIVNKALAQAQGKGMDGNTLHMLRLSISAAQQNSQLPDEIRVHLSGLAETLPS